MNETTPGGGTDAPQQPSPGPGPYHGGPRVSRDEMRDLSRLRRTVDDKYVAGVAGGIARHLDIDPVIVRVAFVVLTFFGGAGLIVYGACWLLVPEDGSDSAPFDLDVRSRTIALAAVGALAGLAMVGDLFGEGPGSWIAWPLVVIGAIAWFVLSRRDRRRAQMAGQGFGMGPGMAPGMAPVMGMHGMGMHGGGAHGVGAQGVGHGWGTPPPAGAPGTPPGAPAGAPAGTPTGAATPPTPPPSPAQWAADYTAYQKSVAYEKAYAASGYRPTAPGYQAPPPGYQSAPPMRRPRDPRKRGPILFWFTTALVALSLGTLGIVDGAGADVAGSAYPALALGVTALMLVIGSFFGRAGGLIPIGLILAVVLAVATVADRFDGDQTTHAPTSASQVQDHYEMGIGEMVVDLTGVTDLEGLDGRRIRVEGDVGELRVIVPTGIDLGVDAWISGPGEIKALGQTQSGWNVSLSANQDRGAVKPRMELDLDLDFGAIEVVTR